MADALLGRLKRESLSSIAESAALHVQEAAAQVAHTAQQKVNAELAAFEAESAKKDLWKAEKQRVTARAAEAAAAPSTATEDSAPRRLVFSIDEDDGLSDDDDFLGGESNSRQPVAPPLPSTSIADQPSSSSAPALALVPDVSAAPAPAPSPASARTPAWQTRIQDLMTIVKQEAVHGESSVRRMPSSEMLSQLEQLHSEMTAATKHPSRSVAAGTPSETSALQEQVESLSVSLAKAQLEMSSKAESHRRAVEALEARAEAAEAEMLDRMRLVAESAQAEQSISARAIEAEAELGAVRKKAGARLKALIVRNKELEDEVARLKEADDLTQMKMEAVTRSMKVVETENLNAARLAASAAQKVQQEHAYARSLVLRYLELEDQHEALFPALASAFKLTQEEVQRIRRSQVQHASETSFWGLTKSAGTRLVEAARVVASEASSGSGSTNSG